MAIVVRSDLKMSPGLLSAQVLHAGMEFIRQKAIIQSEEEARTDRALKFEAVEEEWITRDAALSGVRQKTHGFSRGMNGVSTTGNFLQFVV